MPTHKSLMGMGADSVIVVHGGGVYGDKEKTKERWCKQFPYLCMHFTHLKI